MKRMRICQQQFFGWLFFVTIISFYEAETSLPGIIDVDYYLQMESAMISKGRNYLSQELKRLKLLETKYLREWKQWRKSYLNQENEYIAVPQNIIHLFKKLVVDLDQIKESMMKNSYYSTMIPDNFEPPTENYLKQVVLSLIDLQKLYDLKSNDIMNGRLLDIQLNTSLTIDSSHFIGNTCLEYNKHLCVTDWLNIWLSESPDNPDRRIEVFRSLYPSYIFMDKKDQAYHYAMEYLKEDRYDISATDVALDLSLELGKLTKIGMSDLETNRLCRGDYDTISHTIRTNLRCRYKQGDSAFLKIAPLKEEDLYDNPKILLYREVIYDSEIELMKAWAATNLKISTVVKKDGKCCFKAFNTRISETGFMDNRSPEFTMLSKRIEDVSDLLIGTAEAWQLLGYPPGGYNRMHTDYLYGKNKDIKKNGNRVASMLFYFNDVILGGETVFTRIGLSVKPLKGAAIIWYNVQRDGSQNSMTDHAACAVIIGEKVGFTQWFRSKNQKASDEFSMSTRLLHRNPSK